MFHPISKWLGLKKAYFVQFLSVSVGVMDMFGEFGEKFRYFEFVSGEVFRDITHCESFRWDRILGYNVPLLKLIALLIDNVK